MEIREFTQCRACQGTLRPVLDLGDLAISDFVLPGEPVDRAPLSLVQCEACELVQLRHSVNRERLYRRYWYRSGVNESMVRALQDVVDDAVGQVDLENGDAVVDIGCNDGTMLRMFPAHVDRIGFEPAVNLWPMAAQPGSNVLIVPGFFPDYMPSHLRSIRPKIITAIAMFYDLDDPGAFIRQVKEWLHPEGVFVLQLSYLPFTLQTNNVGDICHEHVTYWHFWPLLRLLSQHGLMVAKAEFNRVNGGSVRVSVRHAPHAHKVFYRDERISPAVLSDFRTRVNALKDETVCLLQDLHWQRRCVVGLGASTKGNTLLQWWGVGPELLPAIADRSPEKVGRLTAGSGIPIVSEAAARLQQPDDVLVLPFHFMASILARERALYERGTRFIVPLPTLRLVSKESGDADVSAQDIGSEVGAGLAS